MEHRLTDEVGGAGFTVSGWVAVTDVHLVTEIGGGAFAVPREAGSS